MERTDLNTVATSPSGPDILVVDDNDINVYLTTQVLELAGYAFRVARHGEEAVSEVIKKSPALILMDVQMPVLDGLLATRAIREFERTSGTRATIIGVTARAQPEDERFCADAGMDDYLAKPIRKETLLAKLDQWLARNAA